MRYIDRPRPAHGHEGKFSFQYTAAAALLDGTVGIDSFTDARRFGADMQSLLDRIELVQDATIPGEWLNMRVTIEVTVGGRTHSFTSRGPQGAWGRPPLTPDAHEVKLRDCLGRGLARAAIDEVLERLAALDTQRAEDVKRICELLA